MNLIGEPNKEIIDCYSPAKVVKAREYHEEKEALKIKEEEAKLQRKIQRATNALKKAEEEKEKAKRRVKREAKATAKKLAEAAKKASKEQQNSIALKAKKAAPTVAKARKAPVKAKAPAKSGVKCVSAALIEGVVASEAVAVNRRGRAITLPQRYK